MDSSHEKMSPVTIVGSGVMGSGIGVACALKGSSVVLYDSEKGAIKKGLHNSSEIISRLARFGSIERPDSVIERMSGQEDLRIATSSSQIVIESVPEDINLKSSVFEKLDFVCSREKILASNTSGLSITEIAKRTKNPERVIGIHFFAPAYILKTVEIVPGERTSLDVINHAKKFAESIGKVPITLKKYSPNFLVNSLQFAMLREAQRLIEDGVIGSKEEVDLALMHSIPLRQLLFGLYEDSDLISPYSSLTHAGRKDLKTNYGYSEPGDSVLSTRDELLTKLEQYVDTLRSRRPKVFRVS